MERTRLGVGGRHHERHKRERSARGGGSDKVPGGAKRGYRSGAAAAAAAVSAEFVEPRCESCVGNQDGSDRKEDKEAWGKRDVSGVARRVGEREIEE